MKLSCWPFAWMAESLCYKHEKRVPNLSKMWTLTCSLKHGYSVAVLILAGMRVHYGCIVPVYKTLDGLWFQF